MLRAKLLLSIFGLAICCQGWRRLSGHPVACSSAVTAIGWSSPNTSAEGAQTN